MNNANVLIAQLGARKHYQEPLLFHKNGVLYRFYTDFYSGHTGLTNLLRRSKLYNRLPRILKKALDRYEPNLKNARVIHFPRFGYQYLQSLKKVAPQQTSQIFIWAGEEFCHRIIKHGLGETNTIYGFNSACLELFRYAKIQGIRCILDQTLADYSLVHLLLQEEEKLWEGWSLTPFQVSNDDLQLLQREHSEQDLADHIVCGSSFVKDSLIARGVDPNKITEIPLGRLKDEVTDYHKLATHTPQERGDGLRVLFVGSVGLRKGIPYLLAALKLIKGEIPFTCKVAGTLEIKPERIAEYRDVCEFMGRIPRSQIKDLYAWTDVLVLPSICEGSAMVTYEALSLGVPIITTYNSGSIIRDGIDGFIVPIRDSKAIADKLLKIYAMGGRSSKKLANTQEYINNYFKESEHKLLQIINI